MATDVVGNGTKGRSLPSEAKGPMGEENETGRLFQSLIEEGWSISNCRWSAMCSFCNSSRAASVSRTSQYST